MNQLLSAHDPETPVEVEYIDDVQAPPALWPDIYSHPMWPDIYSHPINCYSPLFVHRAAS